MCGSLASARSASGQEEEGPSEASERLHAPVDVRTHETVRLVTIGAALEPEALRDSLGEPAGLEVSVERQTRFDKTTFLNRGDPKEAGIEIWVDATDPARLELYFVDRRAARYAVRTLTLSGTMNEVDREALAQAISWSLRALRDGSVDTLDRTEAAKVLGERESEKVAAATNHHDAPDNKDDARASNSGPLPEQAAQAERWRWAATVDYGATLHSTEYGLVHGPALGAAFERRRSSVSWGFRFSLQLQLPQTYVDSRVELDLTTLAARLGVRLLASSSTRFRWGGVAGIGLDTAWITAKDGADASFVTSGTSVSFLPLPYASLVTELRVAAHWLLEASVGIEGDLLSVHYDVIDSGIPESVVARFPVRPTFTLGARFQ